MHRLKNQVNTPHIFSISHTPAYTPCTCIPDCSVKKRGVTKANKDRVGEKRKSRASKTKQIAPPEPTIEEVQIEYFTRPIYAFPSFDKSDALIHLPSTLSRYMNSGDLQAASKLLMSHLHKDCVIDMPHQPSGSLKTRNLVNLINIMTDIHPDSVMCVHQTKVEENQIWSSLYMKFTDSRAIRESVSSTVADPAILPMINHSREEQVQRALEDGGRSEEEVESFRSLANTNEDILIYIRAEIVMTVDDITKKVSRFRIQARTTSMHLARNHTYAAMKLLPNSE